MSFKKALVSCLVLTVVLAGAFAFIHSVQVPGSLQQAAIVSATPTPSPYTQVTLPGTIQAENYDLGGENVAYHDSDTVNLGGVYRTDGVDLKATTDVGGGYTIGWVTQGEWQKYTVQVGPTGTYTLSVRVGRGQPGYTYFHVEVDGADVTGPMTVPSTGSSWSSYTYTDVTRSNILLNSGTHTVRLYADGDNFDINWLKFTITQITAAVLPGTVQAEDYTAGAKNITYYDTTTSNAGLVYRNDDVDIKPTSDVGGGYEIGWVVSGEWLKYGVNVSATGTYNLSARVGRGQAGTSSFHVEVDGTDVTGPLTVPSTGSSWSSYTFSDVTKSNIALKAGTHTVRLYADGDNFDINWLKFSLVPIYALTVAKSGTGTGTITSNPVGINCGATCSANYNSGTAVTLTATPAAGSAFTGWSGACTGTGACSVTMSAAESVGAVFMLPTYALTVTKSGTGTGTITSNPAGINCGATCSANYNSGTVVTLTATPAAGSTFTGWSGACTGTGACSVTMSAARSVTATFALSTYILNILTVSKLGTGTGAITSNPPGINCGATCSASYNAGTVVTLTAAPASGYGFTGWSGACIGIGTCTVTLNSAKSVTANFVPGIQESYFGMTEHNSEANGLPQVSVGIIRINNDQYNNFGHGTTNIKWSDLETCNGGTNQASACYHWGLLDYLVKQYNAQGYDIIYTFGYTPDWASSSPNGLCEGTHPTGSCYPPSNQQYWKDFVTAITKRYNGTTVLSGGGAGRIQYWGIWNEPNSCTAGLGAFWYGCGSTASLTDLAQMAKDAYPIIHAANSTNKALTPDPQGPSADTYSDNYLTQAGKAGVCISPTIGNGICADIVAFHAYVNPANLDTLETTLSTGMIDGLITAKASHGASSLPLWDTESGWELNSNYPNYDK